jgi:multiple sugar transport system permease protein
MNVQETTVISMAEGAEHPAPRALTKVLYRFWMRYSLGYTLILPTLIVLALVCFFPILYNFYLSFTDYELQAPLFDQFFVGWDNYYDLFDSDGFWRSLKNTFIFTFSTLTLVMLCGMSTAFLLNQPFPWRSFVRGLWLLPWALPPLSVGIVWKWLYNDQVGLITHTLQQIGIDIGAILASGDTAMMAIIFTYAWRAFPFVMLAVLAGLQAIDPELYDAAAVDGASAIGQFFHITLPMLRGVLFLCLALETMWIFNQFDLTWILTGGGPAGATHLFSTYVYQSAFMEWDYPRAATTGVVIFLFNLGFVLIYIQLFMKRED